ncbi:MFS transporter [Solirubrobacter sp. CPCC 204708]|uniref:MFS transporter n=1 Tax=Solirubrobacter deserti TaxID=2282478 RepID=A0ABT4RP90_9ACTN|nr:MFS transporter [Solirubrobacter deserti]MBE2315737.1 MFS transporter [Solirubrobacter deserti]MDA0140373.1 MFS transporter [Solirubrobacter deserti]
MQTAHPRRWTALAVIALAQFMVIMDTSIIGVALPEIQADLGFTPDSLSWVFNAYVIALGGLLLLGGRLSDLLGAKRIFSLGWLVLATGSLAAGLADSTGVEITARAVQGAGAALIAPSALTLLMMLFGNQPKELMKAFAIYGAAAPAGGTAGVFLGGVMTEWISWPWVFYINIPIALGVLAVVPGLMPSAPPRRGSIDFAGALTATAGLALTVFGVVRAPEQGWRSAATLASLAGGVALLGLFVVVQAARREPLMRLGIFRAPNLGAANVVQLLLGAAWIPMWFFLNLYLQQVLGYGAFESGAALLPMTVTIMVLMVAVAPKVTARYGPKSPIVAGLLLLAAGMTLMALVRPNGSFLVDVLPASLIAATGMSLAFIPSLGTAIQSAKPEEGGLASGIVNTSYQVGSALGLAVMTALATSQGADHLGNASALTDGYSAAFLGAAGIALIGALAAIALVRIPKTTAAEPSETPEAIAA